MATAKKTGFAFYFPVLLMIGVNVAYNVVAKLTPADINTFASVFLTYFACLIASFICFFVTKRNPASYVSELKKTNWTAPALGAALIMMEVGILLQYAAGWGISMACLVLYILLAICLLIVGAVFYKEHVGIKRIIGCFICAGGLVLVIMF